MKLFKRSFMETIFNLSLFNFGTYQGLYAASALPQAFNLFPVFPGP